MKGMRNKSEKNYRKIEQSSVVAGVILILLALVIVSGHRIITTPAEQDQMTASYGHQSTASKSQNSNKENKIIRQSDVKAGTIIDEYEGVPVYSNGADYMASHGLSNSEDGYYYGYKWQCVEYVKRFYYLKFGHKMPDGAGNAKFFYNPMLEQGEFNEQRGLIQYHNGGNVKPKVDDLLVFYEGSYGHVAIISEVSDGWIEVVQQNSETPRKKYQLLERNGTYTILDEKAPAGWLRMP